MTKVLFYRYNSICEPIFINALRSIGIDVVEDTTEMISKNLTAEKNVRRVEEILRKDKFVFVMSINYYPFLSAVCEIYNIPYVSIIVDAPVLELYSDTLKNKCNRVFIFDKALYDIHKNVNPEGVFHMPLCADNEHVMKVIKEGENIEKYYSEVSFIGSLYTEKCPYNNVKNLPEYMKGYFDGLIDTQLKIYGWNFLYDTISDQMVKEFCKYEQIYKFPEKARRDDKRVVAANYLSVKVSELERIRLLSAVSEKYSLDIYTGSDTSMMPKARNMGFAKSLTEMPLIFNRSKINLQITARTIEKGLSQRVWDVMAAGGFLLMNYQEEICDYFVPGEDMECFSSKEELLEKIDFYLKNDELRKQIAQNGQNKILNYHNPVSRIRDIVATL